MTSAPFDHLDIGYDVPAVPGMAEADIQTPCLLIDLDTLEQNIETMRRACEEMGVGLRVHGKMHKSADIARYQIEKGGAVGICCQKVSEAEAFARAGIDDILVSNQVRDPLKLDRLARLAKDRRVSVCVDDLSNVAELSEAALRHHVRIGVLVELDCGQGRCGVLTPEGTVPIAKAVQSAPGLEFQGLQAYHGSAQHIRDFEARRSEIRKATELAGKAVAALKATGLDCRTVTGAGTGSYRFEGASGVYTELQCGSYAFMDADYRRVLDDAGQPISEFRNALFLLTSVISNNRPGEAVCDAGLKVQSVDSGLPIVFGRSDIEYTQCSDEHGIMKDPDNILKINDKVRLVPGHCDPTCNLHDWYVGVRNGAVETLLPVTARGKTF
jgi:3-hydroxy-D-aspartate aldolase